MKHPLEDNQTARDEFTKLNDAGKAGYRRAVEAMTCGLPSWAARMQDRAKLSPYLQARNRSMSEMRERGATFAQIAKDFGLSTGRVHIILSTMA